MPLQQEQEHTFLLFPCAEDIKIPKGAIFLAFSKRVILLLDDKQYRDKEKEWWTWLLVLLSSFITNEHVLFMVNIKDLDTGFFSLRNIVARPNGQPGGRRNPFI